MEHALKEMTKSVDRIGRILAGMLLKDIEDLDQGEKIVRLRGCGFGNQEIAEMLNTTPLTVSVTLSKHKSKKKRMRKVKKKA